MKKTIRKCRKAGERKEEIIKILNDKEYLPTLTICKECRLHFNDGMLLLKQMEEEEIIIDVLKDKGAGGPNKTNRLWTLNKVGNGGSIKRYKNRDTKSSDKKKAGKA